MTVFEYEPSVIVGDLNLTGPRLTVTLCGESPRQIHLTRVLRLTLTVMDASSFTK